MFYFEKNIAHDKHFPVFFKKRRGQCPLFSFPPQCLGLIGEGENKYGISCGNRAAAAAVQTGAGGPTAAQAPQFHAGR